MPRTSALRELYDADSLDFPTKRAVRMSEKSLDEKGGKMVTVRPGSHVYRLISILGITGEYPMRSLHLIGYARVMRTLVHRLTFPQTMRNSNTDERLTTKLLLITGRGSLKSIRLYKGALPILEWIHPNLCGYYKRAFWNHHFPGDAAHRDRNLRVAEAVAICMAAGIEVWPYMLPQLQNTMIELTVSERPSFYLARDIKKINPSEQNKTIFTRHAGAILSQNSCYVVYNTRNAVMKWNGMGEFKALHSIIELARMNAGLLSVDSAILFGESEQTALKTLLESDKHRRLEFRFDGIYRHVHFIPLNSNGIRLLRMLVLSDWNEAILDLLFDPDTRSQNRGSFEYDAFVDGVYVYQHLSGDLARLIRFREGILYGAEKCEVICFPDQVPLLREYLGSQVSLKTIELNLLERELGIGKKVIE